MSKRILQFLLALAACQFGLPLTAYAALAAPTLQVTASSGTCTLSWNSVSGANGYDVYRAGNWIQYTNSTSYANGYDVVSFCASTV